MKKRKTNRMTALILAAALLLSNIPVTGFAQEETYCGLEHEHEAACYIDPNGTAPELTEAAQPKTYLEKLLAAQSLQEMQDLLAGNEAGAAALSASQLSLVRQRADTIYAEVQLTAEEKAAYTQVSDTLVELVKQRTAQTEPTQPAETTPAPTETTPAPTVPEKTLYEKLLAAETLQELHDLLMGDKAGSYTLTQTELETVKSQADALYQQLSEPGANDKEYFEMVKDTVSYLESQLSGNTTGGNISNTLDESTLLAQLLLAQSMKELYDTLVAGGQDSFALTASDFASVKAYAKQLYEGLASPTAEDTDYRDRLEVAIEHFVSGGKIPLNAIVLTAAVAAKPLGSNYYFLTKDLKLTSSSYTGYIYIPSGATATIDLNGYALIGNKERSVIYNNDGALTIEDSRPNSDPHYFRKQENNAWILLDGNEENAVEVRGGIITGGYYVKAGTGGGGIQMKAMNRSTQTVMNGGTIIGNYSERAGGGSYGGMFTMNGGEIKGNYADLMGGGVSVSGEFTMTGGYIGQNSISPDSEHAPGKGSESSTSFYDNPEITLGMNSYFTMTGGTIDGNISTVKSASSPNPTTTISGGTINGNFRILNKNAATICGTAVFNGRIYMANGSCTVKENGVIQNGSGTNGGAVYLANGSFYMYGGAIRSAEAVTHGGAVYVANGTFTMTDGVIEDNKAGTDGGAVYLQKGTLTMSGGTFQNNTAAGNGGAAYISGGNFQITGGTIDSNTSTASNGEGGAVYVTGGNIILGTEGCTDAGCLTVSNNSAANGGAFAVAGATPIMYCGTLTGNIATEKGGALYVSGSGGFTMTGGIIDGGTLEDGSPKTNAVLGGGVYLAGGAFTLEGTTAVIRNNHATNGAGVYLAGGKPNLYQGALQDNTASGDGGGIYIDKQAVKLEPKALVSITGNRADRGAGIFIGGSSTTPAGFAVDKTKPGRVEITDNTASGTNGNGGGVCISYGYFSLDANNITLQRNRAVSGGAVAVLSGNFTMSDGSIGGADNGNTAQDGGAVYVSGGNVILSGGEIRSNEADRNGGGIAVLDGQVNMTGGSVSENRANSGEGGSIYVSSSGSTPVSVMVYGGTLSNNFAARTGGAVSVQGGSGDITVQVGVNEEHFAGSSWNHTFEHDIDGAVYASAECPVIRNNTSGVSGGAFYIKGASTTRLNIYCLTDENNRTNGDKNPLNENMSNFMMVEGGRVYLSTANQYEGVEGTPNVSPDGDDTSGHMSINGSIHVVSGVLELFGSKDNPRLNGGLTLDIRSTSDKFIDHRKSEDKLTVSYHENFFYPDGTPASRQTAFDIEAEQTHEIYGGLYAHEGYKLYGWNTSSGANPTVDTEGWYKTGDVYTLRMPTTENPDGTRDGLNHFGNLTLYAIWESNGYYVNYVSGVEQGQEYTGKDRTEPYTYDAANQYFLDNWFVWPGHEFTGWLLPDGSIKQPGDAVPNLTTENAATVIVTAQWKPCEHLTGDFSYTLEEDTITKTCNVCKYSATARLTARNATYDGSRHEAVLECSDEAFWKPQVSYVGYTIKPQAAEDTWQPEAIAEDRLCIGAGNYTATITGGDKTVTATYTIAKAKQEAPASRPSYQQPEGGTNKLTVNQIPQAQRLGQSGEHVVYIVRYFEDGNQKDIPVNIPDGDPDQLTVELPALLKVYSVFAGYPETDDYLASELVSAELSFLFTGTLKILVRAEEGINVWLGQVTTDGKDEWVLFAKLISEDDYYLIGEDFTFTKTVTDQPEGESYDANKLTVTKATTITDGYLMSVTEPPEKMTEITIVVGGVKKKADITGYAREKQHFSDFAEQKDPVISRDSAFTARFAVTSYDAADYHPLKLTFSQPLPGGTTIILRDRSDESYWYTAVTAGATEVALSSFTRMAAGGGAYSAGTDMDLQFVVDFSRAASPITAESLTCALSAAAQDADSNVVALSAPLNIGLAGAWLSLDEDVDGSGLSQQIRIKAGAGGAASKYDHRDMALVLTPATTLPPDAYIRMTMGENVSECRPDKTGKIIVPLGNFRALDTDILLDLCSNMFPVNDGSDTEYTMTAQLYLAQTDAEIAPLQAEAPRSTVQLKFTVNKHRTGISIAVANDQRLFTTADTIAATVTVKPAIYNLLYSVDVELHQEFEGNIFGDSMVSVQKSGNTYTFDLNDRPTGDYCIVAALKTRAGYTINEARYYFIIQPSPNDGG